MRLWKTLHTLLRGRKGKGRTACARGRLEVEALGQRLLPSSFSWGAVNPGAALAAPHRSNAATMSYDLATHKAGVLASSHEISGSGKAVSRDAASHQTMLGPTESISLNFVPPSVEVHSFSWGV
jgi:hypothetical protein